MTPRPLLLAPLLLLAACGGDTARSLGLTRDAPDEFQVVTRAPLSIPSSLGHLPAPRPGAQRPQELSARERGESTLAPGTLMGEGRTDRPSSAESALIAQASQSAGVGATSANLRRQVDEEARRLERPQRSLTDRLMFWQDAPPPGTVLDPEREAQRLREAAALGRAPDQGETPIIQRRQRGLLEGLF
ncbi:DUF3035 domain-containing protein [Roseomonas sp. SSH11]|uniref:DUF3035 domain-containing protein n=1 Tax=Pararoseomonas baculiformis TaxID=2820812 RepID=A0ABS4A873_9PROT|nr:DUF3035 domain-containing protein [Pararoseomonas baculiformis]MBP0443202.1 DUF3035 domain-containing protein [Pararoseomonas baculiformis]